MKHKRDDEEIKKEEDGKYTCDEHEHNTCGEPNCNCGHEHMTLAEEYLELAKRVQADFDNFRRHAPEETARAKFDGQVRVLEVFLPCLDTFETAKAMITDEKVLEGVKMIENKIKESLAELGVEEIKTVGEKFDPHVHNVIAVLYDKNKENDAILNQVQAGYVFGGKVVKYPKVVVNKVIDEAEEGV